jgi:hypothetical protein
MNTPRCHKAGTPACRSAFLLAFLGTSAIFGATRAAIAQTPPEHRTEPQYNVGVTTAGMRHLGGVGLGIVGIYRRPEPIWRRVHVGGEALLLHSGERRVRVQDAYNDAFLADSALVSYVYEQVGSVGVGGTLFLPLHRSSASPGLHLPGITLACSGGLIFETDLVGLQSSDVQTYYGYSSPSDTDILFRPYVRPQLMLSRGPFSIVGAFALLPRFASWALGVTYGW